MIDDEIKIGRVIECYVPASDNPHYTFSNLSRHLKLKYPYRVYESREEKKRRAIEVLYDNAKKGWMYICTINLTEAYITELITHKLLNNE